MRSLLLLGTLLLATFAFGQRKQLEKAASYERAGMLQEAFSRYEAIYGGKPKRVEAHMGMKRCAQGIFDRMQQDASGLYLLNDLEAGDRKRSEALAYKQQMDRKGLELQGDALLDVRRRDAQLFRANAFFEQADAAYRSDRFAEAEELAQRSLKLDPERKEAEFLLKLAQLEPLYRQGKRAMELELWRDAFQAFKRVTDRDAGYRDSWALLSEVRERAVLVVTYVPLFNKSVYSTNLSLSGEGQIEAQLAASIKQAILDLKSPLIMLVDRDNTDQLLAEQQRQLSGVFDDRYVVDAGKLIGARYVLTSKILRYDEILRRDVEVQMQLLDAENGRIHLSEIIKVNKQEIGRGNTRAQLLERAAKRMAMRLAEYDPHKR